MKLKQKLKVVEKTEGVFKIAINEDSVVKHFVIRPEHTSDGVPVYHCYSHDGTLVCELRQGTSGDWEQLWGDLPYNLVSQIGGAIAHHVA